MIAALFLTLHLITSAPAEAPALCDQLPAIRKAIAANPYIVGKQKYHIAPALVLAFMTQESGGNPKATSPVGARGLLQIMPRTAELLGCKYEDMYDPATNIQCGVRFMAALLTYTKGDLIRAVSGYNGGSHSTEKSALLGGRIADNPETRNYVNKVLAYYEGYKKAPPCGAATSAPVKKQLIRPNPITAEGGNDGTNAQDREAGQIADEESVVQDRP